jgi:hypothetical protein
MHTPDRTPPEVLERVRHALRHLPEGATLASVARDAGLSWPSVRDIAEGRTIDPRLGVVARIGRAAGLGDLRWHLDPPAGQSGA